MGEKMYSFESLMVWQKATDLYVLAFNQTKGIKDFDFRSQLRRAALSVSTNIAEGFDRSTSKDYLKFLFIARASLSEVKSLVIVGNRVLLFTNAEKEEFLHLCTQTSKLLNGLINSISKRLKDY